MLGVPLRPTGGVAGVTGTPGATALGAFGVTAPISSAAEGSSASGTASTGTAAGATPRPGRTAAPRSARRDPGTAPAGPAGPGPTRAPTAAPKPDRPRRANAQAHPRPDAALHARAHAVCRDGTEPRGPAPQRGRPDLAAAGFTGTVTALNGHGNYLVASQDRTPGASYPCDAAVTIGP